MQATFVIVPTGEKADDVGKRPPQEPRYFGGRYTLRAIALGACVVCCSTAIGSVVAASVFYGLAGLGGTSAATTPAPTTPAPTASPPPPNKSPPPPTSTAASPPPPPLVVGTRVPLASGVGCYTVAGTSPACCASSDGRQEYKDQPCFPELDSNGEIVKCQPLSWLQSDPSAGSVGTCATTDASPPPASNASPPPPASTTASPPPLPPRAELPPGVGCYTLSGSDPACCASSDGRTTPIDFKGQPCFPELDSNGQIVNCQPLGYLYDDPNSGTAGSCATTDASPPPASTASPPPPASTTASPPPLPPRAELPPGVGCYTLSGSDPACCASSDGRTTPIDFKGQPCFPELDSNGQIVNCQPYGYLRDDPNSGTAGSCAVTDSPPPSPTSPSPLPPPQPPLGTPLVPPSPGLPPRGPPTPPPSPPDPACDATVLPRTDCPGASATTTEEVCVNTLGCCWDPSWTIEEKFACYVRLDKIPPSAPPPPPPFSNAVSCDMTGPRVDCGVPVDVAHCTTPVGETYLDPDGTSHAGMGCCYEANPSSDPPEQGGTFACFKNALPPPPTTPPPSPTSPQPTPPPSPPQSPSAPPAGSRIPVSIGDLACHNLGGHHQLSACCASSDARADPTYANSPCYYTGNPAGPSDPNENQACEPLAWIQTQPGMTAFCPELASASPPPTDPSLPPPR